MANQKSVTTDADSASIDSEKGQVKVTRDTKAKAMSTLEKQAPAKPKAAARAKHGEPPEKSKKAKQVRDSYTMPEAEYALISQLKKRCLAKGIAAKKSEILRAAIASLAAASDATMLKAIMRLEVIKTGRPSKGSN
jgi:hypothetical protein